MKYLICSDLHGNVKAAQTVYDLYQKEKPQKVVLCGDIFEGWLGNNGYEIGSIFNKMAGRILSVKGNNDSLEDAEYAPFSFVDNLVETAFSRTLFFTHGHVYNAMRMPALQKGDVFVYGHTHVGRLSVKNGIYVCNCGSLSLPRLCPKSYILIDDRGIYLKDLHGTVLQSLIFE